MVDGFTLAPYAAALFTFAAMGQLLASGLSCTFVEVNAKDDDILVILETSAQEAVGSSSMGVLCDGDFYNLNGDPMWIYSRAFFFVASCFGGIATFAALLVAFFVRPTRPVWLALSGSAALSSILQLPMFLMFETEPCSDFTEDQDCSQSIGSFLLISSTACWVGVAIITQLFDAPQRLDRLENWKISNDQRDDESLAIQNLLGPTQRNSSMSSTSEDSSHLANFCKWPKKEENNETTGLDMSPVDEEEGTIRPTLPLIRLNPVGSARSPHSRGITELPPPKTQPVAIMSKSLRRSESPLQSRFHRALVDNEDLQPGYEEAMFDDELSQSRSHIALLEDAEPEASDVDISYVRSSSSTQPSRQKSLLDSEPEQLDVDIMYVRSGDSTQIESAGSVQKVVFDSNMDTSAPPISSSVDDARSSQTNVKETVAKREFPGEYTSTLPSLAQNKKFNQGKGPHQQTPGEAQVGEASEAIEEAHPVNTSSGSITSYGTPNAEDVYRSLEEEDANASLYSYGMPVDAAEAVYRSLEFEMNASDPEFTQGTHSQNSGVADEALDPIISSKEEEQTGEDDLDQTTDGDAEREEPGTGTSQLNTTLSGESKSRETLGSLVTQEDGDESLLDKPSEAVGSGDEAEEILVHPATPLLTVQDESASPVENADTPDQEKGPSTFSALKQKLLSARMRSQSRQNYARMVDDEDSDPSTPPLEVVTINLENDDDLLRLRGVGSAADDDKELMEDWNNLHNIVSPGSNEVASHIHENSPRDPEIGTEGMYPEQHLVAVVSPIDEEKPSIANRRQKHSSSRSVVSATSLLDTTIEEETLADLAEEADEDDTSFDPYNTRSLLTRTRSAPDLAALPNLPRSPKAAEDLTAASGINNRPRIETFRGETRRHRSMSPVAARPTPMKNVSIFREDREKRAGIHTPGTINVEPHLEAAPAVTSTTQLSQQAREARLRRLAETRGRPPKAHLQNRLKETAVDSAKLVDLSGQTEETAGIDISGQTEDDASSKDNRSDQVPEPTPDEESSSGEMSVLLESLDLQLVEMQRDDDTEYGPEEASL